jgi:hypothetical protein
MIKYRIKVYSSNGGDIRYALQKRLFGFLWWHNPMNINAHTTGIYNTLNQALDAHKIETTPDTVEYIPLTDVKDI